MIFFQTQLRYSFVPQNDAFNPNINRGLEFFYISEFTGQIFIRQPLSNDDQQANSFSVSGGFSFMLWHMCFDWPVNSTVMSLGARTVCFSTCALIGRLTVPLCHWVHVRYVLAHVLWLAGVTILLCHWVHVRYALAHVLWLAGVTILLCHWVHIRNALAHVLWLASVTILLCHWVHVWYVLAHVLSHDNSNLWYIRKKTKLLCIRF